MVDDENPIKSVKTILIDSIRLDRKRKLLVKAFTVTLLMLLISCCVNSPNFYLATFVSFIVVIPTVSILNLFAIFLQRSFVTSEKRRQLELILYEKGIAIRDNNGITIGFVKDGDLEASKENISMRSIKEDHISDLLGIDESHIGFIKIGNRMKIGPFEYCADLLPLVQKSLLKNMTQDTTKK
jgi:hypothetical protein